MPTNLPPGSPPPAAPVPTDHAAPGSAGTRLLAEVQRCLAAGDRPGAIRAAFPQVMVDVQLAYGLRFPPHWTARDALAHGLRPDMGRLSDLLFQLYALYEPVRFGEARDWVEGDVGGLVRAIYAETSLRGHRAEAIPQGGAPTYSVVPSDRTPEPTAPGGW